MFVDGDRRYLDCSDGVCNLLGYRRPEILSKSIDDLGYDKSEVAALFETYLKNGLQQGDFILRHKTGRPIYVKYHAWKFEDGCLAATWQPAEKWEQLYVEALLEFRSEQLQVSVAIALKAIRERQASLTGKDSLETHIKLREAFSNLRAL